MYSAISTTIYTVINAIDMLKGNFISNRKMFCTTDSSLNINYDIYNSTILIRILKTMDYGF